MSSDEEDEDGLAFLRAAEFFTGRGCAVMPVHGTKQLRDGRRVCRCPDGAACKYPGKHAVEKGWPATEYRNAADLYAWWHPDHNGGAAYNVAVRTGGVSGIVVIDVDPLHGGFQTLDSLLAQGIVTPTYLYRTGSGGVHLYVAWTGLPPVPNSAGRLGPGIDIRGENGYVVAPPSRSLRGPYQFVPDAPPVLPPTPALAALFEEWADQKARNVAVEVLAGDPGFDIALVPPRLRALLEEVPPEGQRSTVFHNFVGQAMRAGLTQAQVVTAVTPWCQVTGKYFENGVNRVASAVANSWGNIAAERARLEIVLPEVAELYAAGLKRREEEQPETHVQLHPPGSEDWLRVVEGDDFASVDWPALFKADFTPCWLVENLFEVGRSYSVYGGPGVGKSLVMLDFAAQLASGRLTGEQVPVAYFDRENIPTDLSTRLTDMGYDSGQLEDLRYYLFPDVALNTKEGAGLFVRTVVNSGAKLVVIDTLARFVRGVKENESEWVTDFFNFAVAPLRERGITFVRLDHTGKAGDGARGTSAKLGDVDGAWKISFDPHTGILEFEREKSRTGAGPERVQFLRTREPTAHNLRWAGGETDEPPAELPPTVTIDGQEMPILPPLDAKYMPFVEALDRLYGASPVGRGRAEPWLRKPENGGFRGRSSTISAICNFRNARVAWATARGTVPGTAGTAERPPGNGSGNGPGTVRLENP